MNELLLNKSPIRAAQNKQGAASLTCLVKDEGMNPKGEIRTHDSPTVIFSFNRASGVLYFFNIK
jgi:hypothetical protein